MNTKHSIRVLLISLLWLLLAALTLGGATYAWFTFNNATNVEPMAGTVGDGAVSLLISASRDGPFDKECDLPLEQAVEELLPVSTADLQTFYASAAQNKQGITLRYRDVTEQAPQRLMHGTVYLQSKNRGCDVYFFEPKLSFGSDGQALSALRLVLKLTTETDGEQLLFFCLDDLGGGGAEEQATVTGDNVVVSSIDAGGQPGYTADPAEDIGAYLAQADGKEDTTPRAGEQALCALQADEVASVEYWLYLEGCDTACVNAVQTRELSLQLGFAGVSAETTAE